MVMEGVPTKVGRYLVLSGRAIAAVANPARAEGVGPCFLLEPASAVALPFVAGRHMTSVSAHGVDWRSRAERSLVDTADPGTDPESRQTERDRLPVRTRYRRGGSCHPSPRSGRSCCKSSNTTHPIGASPTCEFSSPSFAVVSVPTVSGRCHGRLTAFAAHIRRKQNTISSNRCDDGQWEIPLVGRPAWLLGPPFSTWQHPLTTGHHDCYTFGASRGSPLLPVH